MKHSRRMNDKIIKKQRAAEISAAPFALSALNRFLSLYSVFKAMCCFIIRPADRLYSLMWVGLLFFLAAGCAAAAAVVTATVVVVAAVVATAIAVAAAAE